MNYYYYLFKINENEKYSMKGVIVTQFNWLTEKKNNQKENFAKRFTLTE